MNIAAVKIMHLLFALFLISTIHSLGQDDPRKARKVAITIDDLPFTGGLISMSPPQEDLAHLSQRTRKILDALKRHQVPAIGFVNEKKLHLYGQVEARTKLLSTWLDAGMSLGNHTYSHLSLYNTPLEEYQNDVLRGEAITRPLVEVRGQKFEYFRHPYTNTGPTKAVKDGFEDFLREHDYRIAPFTVENADYAFNKLYVEAMNNHDLATGRRILEAYLAYFDTMFTYFEDLSVKVLGYEVKQILLIHANEINAEGLDHILSGLKKRGYSFISLDQALSDKAYDTPDDFVGRYGPSWLHRWTISLGLPMKERNGKRFPAYFLSEPDPPKFIMDML